MTEEQKEIVYSSNCEVCDEHKTALGCLESSLKAVFGSTDIQGLNLTDELKVVLAKTFYEQLCLDNRTKMIQGFKKSNIKDINK